jgi:hypothetical protein
MSDAPPRASGFAVMSVGALAALVALTIAILAIRIHSVIRQGDLHETSGCEVANIYNIWKVRHGAPLYEWPDHDPYSLTSYNAGFYHTYARILSLFDVADEHMPLGARLTTFCFALLGAVGQWMLIRTMVVSRSALADVVAIVVAIITWFGGITSWWVLTTRPDIGGVAFSTWGLALLARQPIRAPARRLLLASLLFTAAWTFKHSLIWTLAGCCLFLLLRREFRAIVALVIPLALVSVAMLLLGSDAYRYNLLGIHRDFAFNFRAGPMHMAAVLIVGAWFWGMPMAVLIFGQSRRAWPSRDGDAPAVSDSAVLVGCAAAVSFVFAVLGMSKDGADRNYVFEALIPAASLAGSALINLMQPRSEERQPMLAIACNVLLLALLALPIAQLLGVRGAGQIRLLDAREEQRAIALKNLATSAPKPLYARPPMLSLPWVSTNDTYPAFVLDEGFRDLPSVLARAERPLLRGRVESRFFASLLMAPDDPLYRIARDAGYVVTGQADDDEPVLLTAPPREK